MVIKKSQVRPTLQYITPGTVFKKTISKTVQQKSNFVLIKRLKTATLSAILLVGRLDKGFRIILKKLNFQNKQVFRFKKLLQSLSN